MNKTFNKEIMKRSGLRITYLKDRWLLSVEVL